MSLVKDWNACGGALPPRGAERPSLRDLLNPMHGLTVAELKAIPPDERSDGQRGVITATGTWFRFHSTSALTGDDQLVIAPTVGTGRWLAEPGQIIDLSMAIGFATADAAVLYTMPVGSKMLVRRGYWGVSADWTGGASSAIGLSSSQTVPLPVLTTKGDLHGGVAGDVAAMLVAASGLYIPGTIGADVAAGVILVGGSTVRFDRITSAFTAGAGFAHVVGELLANPGA